MSDKKRDSIHVPELGVFFIAGFFIMAGLMTAGFFVKQGLVSFRTDDRVVTVKGLSERDVEADLAIWTLSAVSTGNVLGDVQSESEASLTTIEGYLKDIGFGADEIDVAPIQMQDLLAQAYRPNNVEKGRYLMTQQVTIRTTALDRLDAAVDGLSGLLKQNVTLTNMQPPTYIFSGLNRIKPEMLSEAVKKARQSAQEFATESGAQVGGIKRAYQGVFQILPRDPVAYIPERNQRFKTVRVVSTVDFYIE